MSIQGTWADALIIQAVEDALKVTIQIVKSEAYHPEAFETMLPIIPDQ